MEKLFKKNELIFALIFIALYVIVTSLLNGIYIPGVGNIFTLVYLMLMFIVIFFWIINSNHKEYFGLKKSEHKPIKFLYYLPLVLIVSSNLWFGVSFYLRPLELVVSLSIMLFVGILEEIIFRGFLFKAMEKDNVKAAIIVSSITFGIGHIVNLFNFSRMMLLNNLGQIVSAISIGFLFVTIFYKSKSIYACIIAHSLINMLDVFSNYSSLFNQMIVYLVVSVIAILYGVYLYKTLKKKE